MGEFILRNLFHRPLRTLIAVLAVAVEVTLVVIIVGLTSGLLTETAKRIEGVGADIMLQAPSSSVFLAFSGSPMPIKIADKLKELKYVQYVSPVLFQFNTSGIELVYGIDQESFREGSGGFVFLQGQDIEGPDDLLVDDVAAKAKHVTAGQTYRIFDHDWRGAGVVEQGKGARLFVALATLQESLGADKQFIVRALLAESVMVCAFGIIAGIGLSFAVRAGFVAVFPTLTILITPGWMLRAAGIAFSGAVFGASYPAWVASRKDPVEALCYD